MILISGPCVIESREILFRIAEGLKPLADDPRFDFYFKASFDKANRTSLESFRGPGLKEGLKILSEVKQQFGYRILTDVHETAQVQPAAEVVDIVQIPAFLCRQTDLLVAAGKTDAIINIKKGQFMNPRDMGYSVTKTLRQRSDAEISYELAKAHNIWLTERGSSFGYGNLVVDMRSFSIMREFAPVIYDVTHSVQMPGAGGGKSSGDRTFVPPLAKAAAAYGVDGFFFETHVDPDTALSDGPNMIQLQTLLELAPRLLEIRSVSEHT